MKLVHAADLHIDSPLRGLDRYEGAPSDKLRDATRDAFKNLVGLCLDERADLLLLAGDIYDGDWKDYSTGLFFAEQLSRLRVAGVQVVLIQGNHDAEHEITRRLDLPENARQLDTRRPETAVFEKLGVAVHGQGFGRRAVTDDLAAGYPAPIKGLFNVGLLHTCASGRPGHDSYAPCAIETLIGRGYDYWALGHVHAREVLSESPCIVFPGNLQGRHARETGEKGATVVTVDDGRIVSVEHRPLDVVRWCVCEIDVADAESDADVIDLTRRHLEQRLSDAEGRMVAARVALCGKTRAHAALHHRAEELSNRLRAMANDVGQRSLWIEKIRLRTEAPLDVGALEERDDAIGQLARSLRALRGDEAGLAALLPEFAALKKKLPAEVREGDDAIRLDDPAFLREALEDVEQMLISRLLGAGEAL